MDLLLSIPIGVTLQLLAFVALRRLVGMAAMGAALVVALASLAVYVPYAILVWPGADVLALHLAIYLVTAYALGLIGGYRAADGERGFHWGPTAIVAFFVVLVLFDAVLVAVATRGLPEPVARMLFPDREEPRAVSSAFPGVVDNDMQKKQAQYNAYLEQVERQRARGWTVRKGWVGAARAGEPALFQVAVADRDGRPVTGAEARGRFLRPADTRQDRDFELQEISPGLYQARLSLPSPGVWNLVLQIRRGDDVHEIRAATKVADPGH